MLANVRVKVCIKSLTFKGQIWIYQMQPPLSVGQMFDISNAIRACSFSAVAVFTCAGNQNKPTVGPTTRPGFFSGAVI